jgi:hypothetical protein
MTEKLSERWLRAIDAHTGEWFAEYDEIKVVATETDVLEAERDTLKDIEKSWASMLNDQIKRAESAEAELALRVEESVYQGILGRAERAEAEVKALTTERDFYKGITDPQHKAIIKLTEKVNDAEAKLKLLMDNMKVYKTTEELFADLDEIPKLKAEIKELEELLEAKVAQPLKTIEALESKLKNAQEELKEYEEYKKHSTYVNYPIMNLLFGKPFSYWLKLIKTTQSLPTIWKEQTKTPKTRVGGGINLKYNDGLLHCADELEKALGGDE